MTIYIVRCSRGSCNDGDHEEFLVAAYTKEEDAEQHVKTTEASTDIYTVEPIDLRCNFG